jgi:hypothetical protein
VKVAGDEDAGVAPRPEINTMSREQYAHQVLRILRECGELDVNDVGSGRAAR